WEWGFNRIRAGYLLLLGWSLHHRPVIVMLGVVALGVALAFIPLRLLGVEFAPAEDDGQFSVSVQLPPDASLTATNEAVLQMEALLKDIPEVRGVFASVGGGSRNSGNLSVELVDKKERTRGVAEVMAQVRNLSRVIPEATVRANASAALGGGGGFVQVVVMGDDLTTLNQLVTQVQEVAKTVNGVADAQSSAQARQNEDRFVIDRERASSLGVTGQQVGSTLRTLVQGTVVSQYKPTGETAQALTLVGPPLTNARSLSTFPIASGKLGLVRVAQVTKFQASTSPVTITRTDRKRSFNVSIVVANRPLGDTVTDLRAALTALPMPPGYRLDVRGSAQQLDQAMTALTAAISLSVVLMYMLLVALYESWLYPLAIMFSLPVSLVGAFGGLILTANTINIFSMMGMIALMGLVAKNAILLVDYTNTLRARGVPRYEALLEAGNIRLRPIAMTTLTVIFAMIPLALKLEAGGESRAPMAMVIIGGSISSTLLTLMLVPVMYTYLDTLQTRFGAGFSIPIPFRRRRQAPAPAAVG
ncbi:MAG: efflux RND transporter permease subunit, partial [Chloroflexi bacterium]|nr:efflux RND transporter permease subunit [Chloroflexota bacterium]